VLGRFFKSRNTPKATQPVQPAALPAIPPGVRVYAIGDIHGRLDLLTKLLALIDQDSQGAAGSDRLLVYLGDYVDRGPASQAVVERVIAPHTMVDRVVCLRGNHEDALMTFLSDAERGRMWLDYGGMATLHSYGVRLSAGLPAAERIKFMAEELNKLLPASHRQFYQDLKLSETIGDYFFVHAGVDPHQPFDEQDDFDMMTIRSPFIDWGRPLEKVVVHGHTIADAPEFRSWRIGIDTGAYATGRLTCLVLEGSDRHILTT
jgi:serine/threonine protein phosphatase 1